MPEDDEGVDMEVRQRIINIHESVARIEENNKNIENKIDKLEKRMENHEDDFEERIQQVEERAQENRDYIKKAVGAVTVVVTSASIFGVFILEEVKELIGL